MIAGIERATADPGVGLVVKVRGNEKVGVRDALLVETFIREYQPSGRFENPHLKIWLDREWLVPIQVHTWDENGIARGRYTFVDITFNTGLGPGDFTPKATGM
jgi:outer membrane lipoprotein-sorting protein